MLGIAEHHGDAVADALDHRQIVRDEQVGKVELVLQVAQQVDDLHLGSRRRTPKRPL
jgi:hypothetical protein